MIEPPRALEERVAELLRATGYTDVQVIGGPNDSGVDVLCKLVDPLRRARVVAVQVKRYRTPVGRRWNDELLGVVSRRQFQAEEGIVFTTSDYSKGARKAASGQPIQLIDGAALIRGLAEHKISLRLGELGELRGEADDERRSPP